MRSTVCKCHLLSQAIMLMAVGILPGLPRMSLAAAPAKQPSPRAETTNPSPTNPVLQQLNGRWQTITPPAADIQSATLAFTPTGKVLILTTARLGEQAVVQLGYAVDPNPKPMHVDFTLPDPSGERVKSIFEFTPDGLLRIELTNAQPNQPRPRTFKLDDPPFRKVSPSPSLQPDWRAIAQQAKASGNETEGRLYARAILQAQLAHHLEHNTFAKTFAELGVDLPAANPNYRYQLVSDDFTAGVSVAAVAQRLGLRSFAGSAFKVSSTDNIPSLMAATCQTKEPSRLPPASPGLTRRSPENAPPQIQCAADTVMAP